MIAFGAFRPEVFGNLVGDEGLKIGDLPEMKIEHETNERGEVVGEVVAFEKIPTLVIVRKSLSKVGSVLGVPSRRGVPVPQELPGMAHEAQGSFQIKRIALTIMSERVYIKSNFSGSFSGLIATTERRYVITAFS